MLYFLVFFLVFTIFNQNIFAADDCLEEIEDNNVTQNSKFICNQFNFTNKVGTHDCKGNILEGNDFIATNGNLKFYNCEIKIKDIYLENVTLRLYDSSIDAKISTLNVHGQNENSSLYLYNSDFEDNDFSSFGDGEYYVWKNITFNIKDELNEPIENFRLNYISQSSPIFNGSVFDQNSIMLKLFRYNFNSATEYFSWSNYSIDVFSSDFGSSNNSVANFTDSSQLTLTLKDFKKPEFLNAWAIEKTNHSLNIEFVFDEKVNGTFSIHNSSDHLIEEKLISNFLKKHEILFDNLKSNSVYDFKFTVYDRFGNDSYSTDFVVPSRSTYQTLNITYDSSNENFQLDGNPTNTQGFNFSSIPYKIKVEYLEPVNIQDKNLSNEFVFENNLLRIEGSNFLKHAKVYFNNLNFQTTPYLLKNDNVCSNDCDNQNYSSNSFTFNETLDLNTNYSLVSNSILLNSTTYKYVGKNITFYVNYSDYYTHNPIVANCTFQIDSNSVQNMNFLNGLYEYMISSYLTNATHSYDIICKGNSSYDEKSLIDIPLILDYQPIEDFTTNVQFEDEGSKLTKKKWIKVNIDSNNKNTNETLDLDYYFMITRDKTYSRTNWEDYNLTNWININQNESFEIFNTGEEYTLYNTSNSFEGNFSNFIFIDERDSNGDGTTLYVVVKACVPGGNCKYYANENNNLIYEDMTAPELIGDIKINNFYNSKSKLVFGFNVRDLESKVENVNYELIFANESIFNPTNNIPFFENQNSTFNETGFNLIEGGEYKILFDVTNKVGLKSNVFQSQNFIVDTRKPINASINVSINENNYYADEVLNVSFNAGQDYNFNYSNLGIVESGLDYMKLFIKNATLIDNSCVNWNELNEINETFNESDINYSLNIFSGNCYELFYRVYDKAGNYNEIKFDKVIKYDNSSPVLSLTNENVEIYDYTILANGDEKKNAENLQRSLSQLKIDDTLFYVKYNITDNQSLIDYYNIEIVNNETGIVVKNFTNYSSNVFEVKFNESYIKDNTNYKIRVNGVNHAGLVSNSVETDGATIFVFKLPEIELSENYFKDGNNVLDFSDNQSTILKLNDIGGYNISCQYNKSDLGYNKEKGPNCLSDGSQVICNFNTTIGLNEFHISCKSDESATDDERIYNNASNNYDLEIFVEENYLPFVNVSEINISQDQVLDINLNFIDNNSQTYLIGNYSFNIENLSVWIYGAKQDLDLVSLNFNDELVNQSSLKIVNSNYIFSFNNTISYLEIKDLCDANLNCKLNFNAVNWNENILSSSYNLINSNKTFNLGISNQVSFENLTNYEGYNFTFDDNGNLKWDLENNSIRKNSFNITFWVKDDLELNKQNVTVNVLPVYYFPKLNESYYNISNQFSLDKYEIKIINISKYFYEENSQVGLDGNLSYLYLNRNNLEIKAFDKNLGLLEVYSSNVGNGKISVGAINKNNQSLYTNLSFNIVENNDNVSPQIIVVSPVDNFVLNSSVKAVDINLTSNENLANIILKTLNNTYILCDGFCQNYSNEVFLPDLKDGDNELRFFITDFGGNTNSSLINLSFNFNNSAPVEDTIYSNINGSFYIGNESNLTKDYSGHKQVLFKDENNVSYVDFVYDFSSNLSFENVSVVFDNSSEDVSLVVTGLNLSGQLKSVWLPHSLNNDFTSICIKDEEVFSLSQMSDDCLGFNEYYLNCDGNVSNGYACIPVDLNGTQYYKINGLSHSAVKLACTENWQVGSWSSCSNSVQTRTVTDLNNCGTSFNKPLTSQSCSSVDTGGSTGGSSGGSSSSGSSSKKSGGSTYVPPPKKEESKNETKVENNSQVILPPVVEQPKITPIYLGNLGNGLIRELEVGKKYSFNLNGNEIAGELVQGLNGVIFETNSREIGFDKVSIDINNDGIDDLKVYLKDESGIIYLTSEKIELETPVDIPQELPIDEKNNNVLIGILIVLVVAGISAGVYLGYEYYKKNKHTIDSKNAEKVKADIIERTVSEAKLQKNVQAEVAKIYYSFDSLADKLVLYSENLKDIVTNETDLIQIIKEDCISMVEKGFSWTDIYFYLKSRHLSNFYISRIINFEYLVDKLENFVLDNDVSQMSNEVLQNKLLSQNWVSHLYIFDSDGNDILRDVLFMIAGSNIYGFKRNKFIDLFNDEFERGKKEFISIDFKSKFNEMNMSEENFDLLNRVQNDLQILRKELFNFMTQVKKMKLSQNEKNNLLEISTELDKDIRKHLD